MVESKTELPRNVQWELARIRRFPAVVSESVEYSVVEDNVARIGFQFRTDPLLDAEPAAPITDLEPVFLLYWSPSLVGRRAPVVISAREDFPRSLPHLNPTGDDRPASLCLARTGLQPIYDRFGIAGVLDRLSNWFSDAKTQTLHAGGWEPVPIASIDDCALGYIDAAALQRYASARPNGGYGFICAGLSTGEDGSVFLQAATPIIDTENAEQRRLATQQMNRFSNQGSQSHTAIPAVFCWPARKSVDPIPRFNRWVDMTSLKAGLEETNLWNAADEASIKSSILFSANPSDGASPESDGRGRNGFLLIVGLWRPAPLDRTISGLVEDDDSARALELRAFYLDRDRQQTERWTNATRVRIFFGLTPATPEILEAVSGEPALPAPLLLGVGALGSALLDHAVRGGTNQVSVVDNDHLLAHNLARHRAEKPAVREKKTDVAQHLVEGRAQDVVVEKCNQDLITMSSEDLVNKMRNARIVIDATAEPQVRSRLSDRTLPSKSVIRTEIFHRGRMGVSLHTTLGAAHSLNFLYHYLISLAASESSVKAWLAYESTRTFQDEELLLGFGCRSLTTKLPAYKVDAHAAAAFAFAKKSLRVKEPLIALNLIDDEGLPQGAKLITPEPALIFEGTAGLGDWRVVISDSAKTTMHEQRKQKAPIETGGYLYGSIDEAVSEICILYASPEPPGTTASQTQVELGQCGLTGEERAFLRRTYRRLQPVGTWHSHPAGEPSASKTDWHTVNAFRNEDAARGLPTVMAITALSEDRVYVLEP
jgi:proteasome lid subunit RPN8/RPN11